MQAHSGQRVRLRVQGPHPSTPHPFVLERRRPGLSPSLSIIAPPHTAHFWSGPPQFFIANPATTLLRYFHRALRLAFRETPFTTQIYLFWRLLSPRNALSAVLRPHMIKPRRHIET